MFILQQDKKTVTLHFIKLHLTRYAYILESTESIETFFFHKKFINIFRRPTNLRRPRQSAYCAYWVIRPWKTRKLENWLLMMVWSKRGNINTAAVVTIAQCNTLVARCSSQLIGPADWVFVTLGHLHCD